jgi:hypothetical protein
MRKGVNVIVLFAFLIGFSPASHADGTLRIKGVRVDGGAMSAVGVTMTTLADEAPKNFNKFLKYAGWSLIVGGLLIDSGSILQADAQEIPAKPVWKAMTSEARLVQAHSPLIDTSSPIVNAANKSGVSVDELADLTLRVDQVTAAARSQNKVLSVDQVVASVANNSQEQKLATNMATIALMSN